MWRADRGPMVLGAHRRERWPSGLRRAFSLMELILVAVIISMIAAMAMPRFSNSLARFRAEAAAERIASDMKLLRERALQTSSRQVMSFDLFAHTYQLPGVPDFRNPARPYEVSIAGEPFGGIIKSADFGGKEELEFDGYGVARSGGSVVVWVGTSKRTVTLDATGGKAVIR